MTELVFIMDRSGSMCGREEDVVGGFNSVLNQQKKEQNEGYVTSVLFNDTHQIVVDRVSFDSVKPMEVKEFMCSGCTAMYDAIGFTVDHISKIHKYIKKEDVPEKTIVVITTDGLENASREYSRQSVKRLIEQKKEEGWQFLFLAANMDAAEAGEAVGIDEEYSVNYHNDARGTSKLFRAVNRFVQASICGEGSSSVWREELDEDYTCRS